MSSPIFDSTFGTGRFKHEEPMTTSGKPSPEPQNVREAFMQVLASLVAAVSLLKRGGKTAKKAAPSDKMFDQMILDYEKAIEQGRAALAQSDAEPFPQPQRNDGGEPCGECHLQTGETCDVCGALAQSDAEPHDKTDKWDREHAKSRVIVQDENGRFEAIDKPTLAQSNAVPKQEVRDKLLRALERRRFVDEGGRYLLTQSQAFDAFTEVIAAYPALTQSNAEPVAYDRAWDAVMHSPELALTRRKLAEDELGLLIKVVAASLYAPPRPDVSAGLLEAAEIAGRTAGGAQYALEDLAATLRARAADRSA